MEANQKKIAVTAAAVIAVVLAAVVGFKTLGGGGNTQAGVADEAKAMSQKANATQVIPPDQYKELMSKARMPGGKK